MTAIHAADSTKSFSGKLENCGFDKADLVEACLLKASVRKVLKQILIWKCHADCNILKSYKYTLLVSYKIVILYDTS